MWFKNIRLYRLTQPFSLSPEALAEKLASKLFQPCGGLDLTRYGFVPPLGRHGTSLVHATNGCLMVCAKKQEKILPGAVVNEHLDERVSQIEQAEKRRVSRKERQDLKDEVIFSLLPKAFVRSRLDFAYIDTQEGLIVVNAASAKRAEDLLTALREALDTLPCLPVVAQTAPAFIMTQWLAQGHANTPFEMGEECDLLAPKDGRIVRCKKQDLSADEIRNHITVGLAVQKMSLLWNQAIAFVLDDQLGLKRLKFEDALLDKAQERRADTAAEAFDNDFAVMTLELRPFIKAVLAALGGETLPDA